MPQYLKDEIEESIVVAALEVFAARGYKDASISEIAETAGISTGNIYRYFKSKRELFSAVIPEEFPRKLASLLRRRVEALHGTEEVAELEADAPYHVISEELLRFSIEHRERVLFLLARSEATEYAGFAEKIVQDLVRFAIAYARSIRPNIEISANTRFVLEQIYRNFVTMIASILLHSKEESTIREAIECFSRYHLPGMKSLFEGSETS